MKSMRSRILYSTAIILTILLNVARGKYDTNPINQSSQRRKLLQQQQPWRDGSPLIDNRAPWVEVLSWKPRAFLYHNFLSQEETDHIISQAKPYMKRSTVVGHNGTSVEDQIRTSFGTFLSRLHTPTIAGIQERVASWTRINITHQEDMQVLRYGLGQKYGSHYDSLDDDSPRIATVLLYLSDVEEGGETAFPANSEWIDPSVQERLGPYSKCADGHVAAPPRKGDALLFYSLKADGTPDARSLHTGCPVIRGVKWTGTIWIHTVPFRLKTFGQLLVQGTQLPEECIDMYPEDCQRWAKDGECTRNAGYMRGDGYNLGFCRLSCGECVPCAPMDRKCRSANRVKSGYLSLDDLEL